VLRLPAYDISAQNDGQLSEPLRLNATAGTDRCAISYRVGGVDVTADMTAGTYRTPSLPRGASLIVRARVTVGSLAAPGSSRAASVTINSTLDASRRDRVRFITSRS
jgi:hypothetical protein